MKIYISADIEGVTGIAHWDETEKSKSDYQKFAQQMTDEVKAACEGAVNAGVEEIWIKDAHDSGRNIIAVDLPEIIRLVRGWSEHPFLMVQELDQSFAALIMIGYHSFGSSNANPLSHTLNPNHLNYIKLNGEFASEFLIHSYIAAMVNVPVVLVSGDEGICKEANTLNQNIKTIAVNKGVGNSVISIHPQLAVKEIKEGVESILKEDINKCKIKLPHHFKVELSYTNHWRAYKASFYPKMKQLSSTNVAFESDDYFEVLRMLLFVI
jgi:D-amino peptidase